MSRLSVKIMLVFGILFVSLTSCSYYSFKGSLPPHLKTVAIPLFENRTSEFGIAENMTDFIIDVFTRDGSLQIADENSADVLIKGVIVSVRDQAASFDAQETVGESRVYITVNVECTDQVKRQEMWTQRFSKFGEYDPSEGPSGRDDAYQIAYDEIGKVILNNTVENW